MRIAVGHGIGNFVGGQDVDTDADPGRAHRQTGDGGGDDTMTQAFQRHQFDRAGPQPMQRVQFRFRPFGIAQHGDDVVRQDFAGRRQFQALWQAVEQLGPDLRLQTEDLPVHRGGRNIQPPSGGADGAGAADGVEVVQGGGMDAQMGGFHGGRP